MNKKRILVADVEGLHVCEILPVDERQNLKFLNHQGTASAFHQPYPCYLFKQPCANKAITVLSI